METEIDMKEIELTQGYFALVDNEDFEYLNQFAWNIRIVKNTQYAKRSDKINKKATTIQMHRQIMNCQKNMMVDHINGNGLDNRKCNLRICTRSNNLMNSNKPKSKATSKYKGVNRSKSSLKWRAEIRLNTKGIYLGTFNTEKDAAIAYNNAAIKYFGEFAKLNKVK